MSICEYSGKCFTTRPLLLTRKGWIKLKLTKEQSFFMELILHNVSVPEVIMKTQDTTGTPSVY